MRISQSFDLRDDTKAKLDIILSLYSAMVSYLQELRAAVERLTVWGCGLMLLLDGWLVTGQAPITPQARIVISAGILSFATIVVVIIRSLQLRFNGYASVTRRLNKVQMVYEQGAFLEDDILFPRPWKHFGSREWREPIFWIGYVSLAFVAILCIVTAWFL